MNKLLLEKQKLKKNRELLNIVKNYEGFKQKNYLDIANNIDISKFIFYKEKSILEDKVELNYLRDTCLIMQKNTFISKEKYSTIIKRDLVNVSKDDILLVYKLEQLKTLFPSLKNEYDSEIILNTIINNYCHKIIPNSKFRLQRIKSTFLISYKGCYFINIFRSDEEILNNSEYIRLCNFYKKIKNSNQLAHAQLTNSIKMLICNNIGYKTAALHTII
uniref:Uncharacterized protein n=1 Tax=Faxonius propinquus nudivirus TaxID=3139431 RepID=A0AAU8GCA4_9VIRU